MSRIGKKPILIPENIEVKIDPDLIIIKGPKAELKQPLPPEIKVGLEDKTLINGGVEKKIKQLQVGLNKKTKNSQAIWGLFRSLIFNMVKGVSQGFEKKLEIEGVGYRAAVQGKKLILNVGFSHSVEIEAPAGIEFAVNGNVITVSGADKQIVGQIAAEIRSKRKPEPYKGTGIHYLGEVIRRKAGKKASTTTD